MQVDILTGTPGKINDFVDSGKLKLDQVSKIFYDVTYMSA